MLGKQCCVWILCAACVCQLCGYDDDAHPSKLLFISGKEPLHEHVAGALGTCVAAMAQLNELDICQLPLLILKALAEREQPLQRLHVWSPSGVNWVST